jgi:hypothetical protein
LKSGVAVVKHTNALFVNGYFYKNLAFQGNAKSKEVAG